MCSFLNQPCWGAQEPDTELKLTLKTAYKSSMWSNRHLLYKKIAWRNEKLSVNKRNTSCHPLLNWQFIHNVSKNSEKHFDTFVSATQTRGGWKEWHFFPFKAGNIMTCQWVTVTPHWVRLKLGYLKPFNPFSECSASKRNPHILTLTWPKRYHAMHVVRKLYICKVVLVIKWISQTMMQDSETLETNLWTCSPQIEFYALDLGEFKLIQSFGTMYYSSQRTFDEISCDWIIVVIKNISQQEFCCVCTVRFLCCHCSNWACWLKCHIIY